MGRLVKLVTSVISLAEAFRTPFEALGLRFSQLTEIDCLASVPFYIGRYEWIRNLF